MIRTLNVDPNCLDDYTEVCGELDAGTYAERDHPSHFDTLTHAEQEALLYWIDHALKPGPQRQSDYTSYGIKHHFETEGFYVSNGQFKGAMLLAGFRPVNMRDVNWVFRMAPPPRLERGRAGRYTLGRFDQQFMELLLKTPHGQHLATHALGL